MKVVEDLNSNTDKQHLVCHEKARGAFDITRTMFWSESPFPSPILNLIRSSHSVLHCRTVSEASFEFYSGWFPLFGLQTENSPPKLFINNNLSAKEIEQNAWEYAFHAAYIYSTKATFLLNTYRVLDAMPRELHQLIIGNFRSKSLIKTVMNITGASRSEVRYQVENFEKSNLSGQLNEQSVLSREAV